MIILKHISTFSKNLYKIDKINHIISNITRKEIGKIKLLIKIERLISFISKNKSSNILVKNKIATRNDNMHGDASNIDTNDGVIGFNSLSTKAIIC